MRPITLSCLDTPCAGPAEQLRFDEELLTQGKPVLRLWEAEAECVVLGYAGRAERDVHMAACDRGDVPILRRCSGGGAVLLGPGCLNYSLVLPLEWDPNWREVRYSLEWTMNRMCLALGLAGLRHEAHSDLALHGRKVSGNAQRRTQHAILHHGTLLYDFDALRVERFLRPPAREPHYRAGRSHADFLGNLPLTPVQIRHRLMGVWC
jgi:lipoate-protein ligase A